jgi:hypothetical protein
LPEIKLNGFVLDLYEEIFTCVKVYENSYTMLEIQACLKKIEGSIKFWSKERGSQGYLKYIVHFL